MTVFDMCAQYDICLPCFEQALNLATEENTADIWFNISHVAVSVGDLNLAYQALKIAISADAGHPEAWNNLGVLEMRRNKLEEAHTSFYSASQKADYLYEPLFNAALLAYNNGNCQESLQFVIKSLQTFPEHDASQDLRQKLQQSFNIL